MMGLIKELANSLTCFRIGVWYAQPLTVVLSSYFLLNHRGTKGGGRSSEKRALSR